MAFICHLANFSIATNANAASGLPAPADIDRIRPIQESFRPPDISREELVEHSEQEITGAPEGSESVEINISGINIVGMTVFTKEEIEPTYKEFLNKATTLDSLWKITANITKKYRSSGYAFSMAYIPPQEIGGNEITINVVEGFISNVNIQSEQRDNSKINELVARIRSEKPLNIKNLESQLLKLNDLPGHAYRAIMDIDEEAEEDGAIQLSLVPLKKQSVAMISIDNYGSRFLGPHELTGIYSTNIADIAQTTISTLLTPDSELSYGGLHNQIFITPELNLEIYGSYTEAEPGYTLKSLDIESQSTTLGVAAKYQFIRQRDTNLTGRIALEGRNTNSDIAGTALVRDRIRSASMQLSSEFADSLDAHNELSVKLSQGLKIFNSSEDGDMNLSRDKAKPNFVKVNIEASRSQPLYNSWFLETALSAQWANKPLYSSEQFGFGGISLGKAYDSSEIVGDKGISFGIELGYNGLDSIGLFSFVPYGFYDVGKIWNLDKSLTSHDSGSSAGAGIRMYSEIGFSADFAVAFPLTKNISTPLYGQDENDPRFLFSTSYNF